MNFSNTTQWEQYVSPEGKIGYQPLVNRGSPCVQWTQQYLQYYNRFVLLGESIWEPNPLGGSQAKKAWIDAFNNGWLTGGAPPGCVLYESKVTGG
jgi:hypothetical protein